MYRWKSIHITPQIMFVLESVTARTRHTARTIRHIAQEKERAWDEIGTMLDYRQSEHFGFEQFTIFSYFPKYFNLTARLKQ